MKKKIAIATLVICMGLSSVGCGSSMHDSTSQNDIQEEAANKEEYNIEEFGKVYLKTQELFENETQYLTKEELSSGMGREIYEKCSKKTGLPFNETVTIRGRKTNTFGSFFYIESEEGEYSIPCTFEKDEPNISLFIKDGENIVVSGVFSEENHDWGILSSITINSPKNIDISFENNVSDILSKCTDDFGPYNVQGEVDSIMDIADFEYLMSTMSDTVNYEHSDYYYDTVVAIKGEYIDEGTIYFMYDKNMLGEIEIGDKVALEGYVDDLLHLLKADGTITVKWGLMGNIYAIYTF